jgi:hypothetical protein
VMQDLGIPCKVTSNVSVQCDPKTKVCKKENGCTIDLCGLDRRDYDELWGNLKSRIDSVSCGHMKIDGQYTGCIYSFLQPSACPKNKK